MHPEYIKHRARPARILAEASINRLGFYPAPLQLPCCPGVKTFRLLGEVSLPARFDLRDEHRLTPVKDQGNAGTCWAFATTGSLESCLLPEETWDFSENNFKNLLSADCPEGFDRSPDGGGNQLMSTAYQSRWSGPVSAYEDPYNPSQASCDMFKVEKHLTRVVFIPDRTDAMDNDNLKTGIMNYGAVFSSMYFDNGYYNDATAAFYAPAGGPPNHAICLVGWDDNIAAALFKSKPPGNGAFIVRNSWGSEWGQEGYFYISYYDIWIGKSNALFCTSQTPGAADRIFQYDPLGWVTSFGFNNDTAYFSNIFEADSNLSLTGCGFYTAAADSTYTITVFLDDKPSQPGTGHQVKTADGTTEDPSYFVHTFDAPIGVRKGQSFTLMVKLITPEWTYPIPASIPLPGYSSRSQSKPGQGFVSKNGKSWSDMYNVQENGSVCLKAFAR